jgi:hypothetical protein
MSVVQTPVSDMLVTVKSREIQRGMLAEMRGDKTAAARHLLAASHLELVLADDYLQSGQAELAFRSRVSAASCLWRAGQVQQSRELFESLAYDEPTRSGEIDSIVSELEQSRPPQ